MQPLLFHVARVSTSAIALAAAVIGGCRIAITFAAMMLFLAAFALVHDLMHGALGLGRRANDAALALCGLVLLMSGHALRAHHLRHHLRPLGDDDLEGAPARLPLPLALLLGPMHAIALRIFAWVLAIPRDRMWQGVETIADLAVALALVRNPPGRVIAISLLSMQCTMAVWAAHIPHRSPAWMLTIARVFAGLRSPTVLSLLRHREHHAAPKVPCQAL